MATAGNTLSQQPIPRYLPPSNKQLPFPMGAQYNPNMVLYNQSYGHNAEQSLALNPNSVMEPLPNTSFLTPSSLTSANPLIPNPIQMQQQRTKPAPGYLNQSNMNGGNPNNQYLNYSTYINDSSTHYNPMSNQYGNADKNRLNAAGNNGRLQSLDDDDADTPSKTDEWLSQPLCLGLTRLSGGILFGSMGLLALASLSGIIAASALYAQDSNTDGQWKVLGIVICTIMLVTIIATLVIFICCYNKGYMINTDEESDPISASATSDFRQNPRQRDPVKAYQLNRTADTSFVPSGVLQDVSTPISMPKLSYQVRDKQTNTEVTIAVLRPKDFNQGVWAATNANGGVSYRPVVQPRLVTRAVQVVPQDLQDTFVSHNTIYQIPAPAPAITTMIQPQRVHSRLIRVPPEQTSFVGNATATDERPRPQAGKEIEKQTIIVQPKHRGDQARMEEERHHINNTSFKEDLPHRVERANVSVERLHHEENSKSKRERLEHKKYVDSDEEPPYHTIKQPQRNIAEDVIEQTKSSSDDEATEAQKHYKKKHGNKKEKKRGVIKVSVKHVKPGD